MVKRKEAPDDEPPARPTHKPRPQKQRPDVTLNDAGSVSDLLLFVIKALTLSSPPPDTVTNGEPVLPNDAAEQPPSNAQAVAQSVYAFLCSTSYLLTVHSTETGSGSSSQVTDDVDS